MKYSIILAITLYASQSTAVVIWPDTVAPCNTTLTACAEALTPGETIEIRTNGPINQSLITGKGVSVVAGAGYKPVFAAGHVIDISGTSQGDLEVTISGLTLTSGRVSFIARNSPGENIKLNITNNHLIQNSLAENTLRINNLGAENQLEINIANNQINYFGSSSDPTGSGGIAINNGLNFNNPSSSVVSGRVYNNQIKAVGSTSVGIGLYGNSNSRFDIDISSNTLLGGGTAGAYIEKTAESIGNSRIDFAHNATYSNQIDDNYRGFMADVAAGELEINAINNTIISAFDGFNFQETGAGELDVKFYNNIVAFSGAPVILNFYNIADSTINIANDNNLFFNNELADPDYTTGPNFIAGDPRIKSLSNARLNPGSPAIDAGNGVVLFGIASVSLIDADGLVRIKNGITGSGGTAIDIGAYESGDFRLLDFLKGHSSNINTIESPEISFQPFPKLQITHNWNPIPGSATYNDHNMGVYKDNSIWRIFTQDQSDMTSQVAFNVWSPAPSTNNFVHTAEDAISASESYTVLDRSGLNNKPNAILAVTQLWEGLYNDNPIGVFYNSTNGKWYIYNSNLVDMPWMASFNVYFQEASTNAFEHRAGGSNISGNYTYIDHPLLNGTPCAQFQVTHKGLSNFPFKTGVYYDSGVNKWAIFNQGLETMPSYARFHVIVSAEQIAECSDVIFANGF